MDLLYPFFVIFDRETSGLLDVWFLVLGFNLLMTGLFPSIMFAYDITVVGENYCLKFESPFL